MDIPEWVGSPQDGQGAGEQEVWAEEEKAKGDLTAEYNNIIESIERTNIDSSWSPVTKDTSWKRRNSD